VKDDVYAYDENYKQDAPLEGDGRVESRGALTDGDFSVTDYNLSRTAARSRISARRRRSSDRATESEVWIANAGGTSAVQLTKNGVQESNAASRRTTRSPVHFRIQRPLRDVLQRPAVLVPASGGTARVLVGENEPYDVDRATWSNDGKVDLLRRQPRRPRGVLRCPAAGGKPRQLTNGKHNIGRRVAVGRSLRAHDQRFDERRHVWTMAAVMRRQSRFTHVFEYLARDFKLGRQEAIQ